MSRAMRDVFNLVRRFSAAAFVFMGCYVAAFGQIYQEATFFLVLAILIRLDLKEKEPA